MSEPRPRYFGTQARILMTEWKAVAKLVVAHSIPAKEKPISIEDLESFDIENLENITFSTAEDLPNILTEKQIQIAMQGPFGAFIREKMSAYAHIARLRLEIHLSKEELFKHKRVVQAEEEKIPAKKLEKLSFSQLDKIQDDLDVLTESHNQEWQNFIEEWTHNLLEFFAQANLSLTEREIKELKDEDIASEVLPRFIEVGIQLPKKDYSEMNFTDYLYLKALLTLQSALSRQHLPHDDKELQQKLKNFQPLSAQMLKQELQLLDEQKKMTQAILGDL